MTREEFDTILYATKTVAPAPLKTFDVAGRGIKTGICIDENVYKAVEPLLSACAKHEYKLGGTVLSAEGKLGSESIAIKGGRRLILLADEYARYILCVEMFRVMEILAPSYTKFSRQEIYRDA